MEVETIFKLLGEWYKLPKYQLERRLDIFFALYLPEILNSKLKKDIDVNICYEDIIPEFPLKKDGETKRSNNADYAIFLKKDDKIQLCLLELKTDMNSIKETQENYYLNAKDKGLNQILEDIIAIRNNSKLCEKYDCLLEKMAEYGVVESSVEKEKRKKKDGGWRVSDKNWKMLPIKIIYLVPKDSMEIKEKLKGNKENQIITFDDVRDALMESGKNSKISKCFIDILKKIENE